MDSKYIILSDIFYPDETGTAYYLKNIAMEMVKLRPTIVITRRGDHFYKRTDTSNSEDLGNIQIIRISVHRFSKDNLFYRTITAIVFCLRVIKTLLSIASSKDTIYCTTNPPMLIYTAVLCKLVRRFKIVVRMDDILPVSLACLGFTPILTKIVGKLWAMPYHFVDQIHVLGRDMKSIVNKTFRINKDTRIIPIWSDTDDIVPSYPSSDQSRQLNVMIAGTIGRMQNHKVIVDAACKLRDLKYAIKFVFFGKGSLVNELRSEIIGNNLENIEIHDSVGRSHQSAMYGQADVVVITLLPGSYGVGVPSRYYNAIAAGKPIIVYVDRGSELWHSVLEDKVGWVVDNEVQNLADVLCCINDRTKLTEIGQQARSVAVSKYRKDIVISNIVTCLEAV